MTIKEWLTPDLFAVVVMVAAVMINLGLMSVVSNFLVDFHVGERTQTMLYGWNTFSFLIYVLLVILAMAGVFALETTLYPNPYDFLLVGKWKVLLALALGLVAGAIVGRVKGRDRRWRIGLGAGMFVAQAGMVIGVLLWLMHQS